MTINLDISVLFLSMLTGVIYIIKTYQEATSGNNQTSIQYGYSLNQQLLFKCFSYLFLIIIGMLLGFIICYMFNIILNSLPFYFKYYTALMFIILNVVLLVFFFINNNNDYQENEMEIL
jgi:uncharacterized protein YacL